MKAVSQGIIAGFVPHFSGGFTNELFFLLMANIETTIAPWIILLQQSAIVYKGGQEKDIKWSRSGTLAGSA
jgi:Mn2+/Fe2+ NRAMP family transporter